jgi:acyl-CoA synthetase (AMP-forming)/AMP-acid ligase II
LSGQALADRVAEGRRQLDAHVRDIVNWHFDPATGSPFWLERARQLDFDPRERIQGYADLKHLAHFEDEWLRGGPVRRWVPEAYADEPIYVFETGGSTGIPKTRVNIRDFEIDYAQFSDSLSEEGFPTGGDWLMLGPSGPRRLRLAVEYLAQLRGGICFLVDLDPRWVNVLIRRSAHQELQAYKNHVTDQALKILRAHDNIRCMFATPRLLEALCEKIDLVKYGIRGIFCGGTEMDAQFHRFAREELVPGVEFVPTYGNTLMGLAHCKPFDPADDYAITYYPPQPRAVIELVDPHDTERTVEYGETGRVMLTTLTRDFFMPRFLERDEAERAEPIAEYAWDGVRNLRLLSSLQESVTVGVY